MQSERGHGGQARFLGALPLCSAPAGGLLEMVGAFWRRGPSDMMWRVALTVGAASEALRHLCPPYTARVCRPGVPASVLGAPLWLCPHHCGSRGVSTPPQGAAAGRLGWGQAMSAPVLTAPTPHPGLSLHVRPSILDLRLPHRSLISPVRHNLLFALFESLSHVAKASLSHPTRQEARGDGGSSPELPPGLSLRWAGAPGPRTCPVHITPLSSSEANKPLPSPRASAGCCQD